MVNIKLFYLLFLIYHSSSLIIRKLNKKKNVRKLALLLCGIVIAFSPYTTAKALVVGTGNMHKLQSKKRISYSHKERNF